MFNVKVLTILPELFPGPLGVSVVGKALKKKIWSLKAIDIRNYATDKYKSVDDSPAGGGAGMVLKPNILGNAIDDTKKNFITSQGKIIYLSPRGKLLTQKTAKQILTHKNIILICGRFEGIDQRVLDHYKIEELSIGNYILSGGELAAFVVIDTCIRLIPGVLGKEISSKEESFSTGTDYENLVEYDQYTKPAKWKGLNIPEVLLSGNHKKIKEWRLENAKMRTQKYRPDLQKEKILSSKEIFNLEQAATQAGTSIEQLMERAGTAVYEEIIKNYKPCKILVLCGPGNNGGDGFVVARLLKNNSWKVEIALDKSININSLSQASASNRSKWKGKIIDLKDININQYDLIVDALFGIGLHREIKDPYKTVIKSLHNKTVISVDIPSGIDSDTGEILGCAIKAELTITFAYKKPAFTLPHLQKYFGIVIVKDIGLL